MEGCDTNGYETTATVERNSQIEFVEGEPGVEAPERVPGRNVVLIVRKVRPSRLGTRDTGLFKEVTLEITPSALQKETFDVSDACPNGVYRHGGMWVTYQSTKLVGTLKLLMPKRAGDPPHGWLDLTCDNPSVDSRSVGSIQIDWEF